MIDAVPTILIYSVLDFDPVWKNRLGTELTDVDSNEFTQSKIILNLGEYIMGFPKNPS